MTRTPEDFCNQHPRVITVWSDIGCPWATLALHTLRTTAATKRQPLLVDHRAFPLELYNARPTPKLVLDAEIVAIGARIPGVGLRLWDRDQATYPVTTLLAMEAVQAAKAPDVGGLAASDQLDAALRRAMYHDHRCISILSEVERSARECDEVNVEALLEALHCGSARADVYAQWMLSHDESVQGSPQIMTAQGTSLHNPGVTYNWTAPPTDGGLPHFTAYETSWAHDLLGETSAVVDGG
ncbi:dithiol-disulfide isomerase [Janibacter sp. Soil728]|uniref:DsbA family oxidoreductase n=1 Tax=Janibacter sp. Soil728 TaxID=1736393 RepID=UPI0006FEDF79|nr:hypothetical protein [Janibacter sp. Soil728]KRE38956.1 dithiol-disulfide isomerase [Janibacter sp. Soil728]